MSRATDQSLLEVLLDSWDRNNTILVNLLGVLPSGGLQAKAMGASHSVAELFTHMHFVRLAFISENVPELARELPEEYIDERDPARIATMLNQSAQMVREAVQRRLESGEEMTRYYDHPILFLQHMIWHEGYHHGQIKLILKAAGHPIEDKAAGRITWGVWMLKTRGVS